MTYVSERKWRRPAARLEDGTWLLAPRRPRKVVKVRKVTLEYRRLMEMPDEQMRKVLAQGMRISEVCAALGVATKALERYFESRLDMRRVWAEARHLALWGTPV